MWVNGEGGIRTRGTVRFTGFRNRPDRPLWHLSDALALVGPGETVCDTPAVVKAVSLEVRDWPLQTRRGLNRHRDVCYKNGLGGGLETLEQDVKKWLLSFLVVGIVSTVVLAGSHGGSIEAGGGISHPHRMLLRW